MPSLGNLNVEIGANLQPLEAGLNKAKSQLSDFGRTATTNLNGADASLKNLYQHLDNLTASLSKTRFGTAQFKELETEITKTTVRIEALEVAELGAAKAGQALAVSNAEVASSSRTLGGGLNVLKDGFGLIRQAAYLLPGIGIAGIFDVIGQAVIAAAEEMNLFSVQSKIVTEAIKDQNEAFASGAGNVTKELTQVQALIQAGRSEVLTRDQRNNAIKELQRIYPGILDNITAENIGSQQATIAINKLTDAIVRKSKAEAIASLISKTQENIFEQQNKPLADQLTIFDKIKAALKSAGNVGGAAEAANIALENQATNVSELTQLLDGYVKQLNAVVVQQTAAGDFQIIKPDKIANVEKAKKAVNELKDDLLNLYNLKGAVQAPGAPETKTPLVPLTTLGDKTLKGIESNANKAATVAAKSFKDIFQSTFEGLFDSIGQSIGDALSGKENPFEAFAKFLGGALKGIGQQLVAFGVEAELIKLALKNPFVKANPGLLIAGGIALEAIGAAFENSISNKTTPHAEGGVFTGPTQIGSHLFGEAGPEFLVGQNKLQQLLQETGARSNHVTVDGNISLGYNEIKIALSRADRYRGRNYGPGNG